MENGLLIAMGLVVVYVLLTNTRRIKEFQAQMKVMKAMLSMHQSQFHIARRMLIAHHVNLGIGDEQSADTWIWQDTDVRTLDD